MADIDQIVPALYTADMPYHQDYDNLPLKNILERINQVNLAVEWATNVLEGACGEQQNVAARLAVALDPLGHLIPNEIDRAQHNIAFHVDGDDAFGTHYVRMKIEERHKLSAISEGATSLRLTLPGPGPRGDVVVQDGSVVFRDSPSVTWQVNPPDPSHPDAATIVKAWSSVSATPSLPKYNLVPVDTDPYGTARSKYKVASVNVVIVEDSLRVYVNGIRLADGEDVYVPRVSGTDTTWNKVRLITDHNADANDRRGEFVVQPPLLISDVVLVDCDIMQND